MIITHIDFIKQDFLLVFRSNVNAHDMASSQQTNHKLITPPHEVSNYSRLRLNQLISRDQEKCGKKGIEQNDSRIELPLEHKLLNKPIIESYKWFDIACNIFPFA